MRRDIEYENSSRVHVILARLQEQAEFTAFQSSRKECMRQTSHTFVWQLPYFVLCSFTFLLVTLSDLPVHDASDGLGTACTEVYEVPTPFNWHHHPGILGTPMLLLSGLANLLHHSVTLTLVRTQRPFKMPYIVLLVIFRNQ